jgi:hypothetical protein
MCLSLYRVVCFLLGAALTAAANSPTLLDVSSSNLRLPIPEISASEGVITIITSPGTPSQFHVEGKEDILSLSSSDTFFSLVCRGAILGGSSETERNALATCSVVSDVFVIDGITMGDVEFSFRNSRHARTLTALFRSRLTLDSESSKPQTLLLTVSGTKEGELKSEEVKNEVLSLFEAASVENKLKKSFDDFYSLQIVPVDSSEEASLVSTITLSTATGLFLKCILPM